MKTTFQQEDDSTVIAISDNAPREVEVFTMAITKALEKTYRQFGYLSDITIRLVEEEKPEEEEAFFPSDEEIDRLLADLDKRFGYQAETLGSLDYDKGDE
jgi:hypothetical protein